MDPNFLEFEQPIAELQAKISELRYVTDDSDINISEEIRLPGGPTPWPASPIFLPETPRCAS